jgi:hypothetical protein
MKNKREDGVNLMKKDKLYISNKSFAAIKFSFLAAILIGLVIFSASVTKIFAIQQIEICNDNLDNDEDGWIDCNDFNCDDDPACYLRPCRDVDLCTWDKGLPLGSENCCGCQLGYNTYWPLNTETSATCTFDGSLYQYNDLYISINNDIINCTLNGNVVFESTQHEGCAEVDPRNEFNIDLTPSAGQNTLICYIKDRGYMSHFDACVVGTECETNEDCGLCEKCVDNTCVYQSDSEDLKDECNSGDCASGFCDGAGACDYEPITTECRASAGVCDVAEFCTGQSADCPSDSKSTAECRGSAGLCDVAEICDGQNNDCPTDVFKSNTEVCRASAGVCDVEEKCTGYSADCPEDVYQQQGTDCDVCASCDGSGNCNVYDDTQDQDCLPTPCPDSCNENPDNYPFTWDWANDQPNECSAIFTCTQNTCQYQSACDVKQCGSECDESNPCLPFINPDNNCLYSGSCIESCFCSYSQQEYCPPAGTVKDGICYYGSRDCTENGCGLSNAPMGCNDICDSNLGPIDNTGPTTSNVVVDPYYNNGNFNVTAIANDTCSNIKKSEYFVGHGLGSCGFAGTGTSMDATDGNFDEKVEDIKKDNVQYFFDGLNYICIQSQDVANNWGNCACAYFESDIMPPDCPTDIYLDNQLYPDEYLICGNNAWLNASVCDQQSRIQGGEYFIDITIPPVPAPWSGYWMNTLYNFTRPDSWKCGIIGALVDTSQLEDGTHYIKIRGKDTAENWGKISECRVVSFIRDTTPPETAKTLIPSEKKQHECSSDEITAANLPAGLSLTNGCQFVKVGTQVVLHATDPDPQGTDEHADKTKIHWIVWYKVNPEDTWVVDQEGIGGEEQDVTITLDKDSYHLIEYWAVDSCGWEETHHFELDIVDNKSPVTTKTIGEPKISYSAGEWYITQQTPIELSCVDQLPHPVDHVTLYARYNVDGGEWVDLTTENGYVKFTFPEDSIHTLEWYCEDAIGNKELTYTETDRVDTTYPETIKTYGQPLVEAVTGGYPKWITSQTPITLTATDGGDICAIGVNKTYWRNTLVDERYCSCELDCQMAEGLGEWNEYLQPFYKPEQSCHLIEYYSVDYLGNVEPVKKQCIYVENTPPQIDKTVDTPKHECTVEEKAQYGNPDNGCWYITQNTKISLNCYDIMPHPVDNVVLYYRDYLLGQISPSYTAVPGGYVDIYKTEDSEHVLEFYCVDALGNSQGTAENPHKEIDIVDTQSPISQKTLGDPKHACTEAEALQYYQTGIPSDGCYFITQNTPITLTCTDGQPHPVDHVKIYYKDYLIDQVPPSFTEVADDHITITKTEDSAHILEWYCVDELGNTESTHVEYDIVDTQKPNIVKTINGPQHGDCPPQTMEDDCFIDGVTTIHVESTDLDPHPVNHVTCDWDYTVTDGTKTGTGQIGVVPPFDINFPEESTHVLTITCKDALGNEETDVEKFIVDKTPPTTTKTYGTPLVEVVTGGYPKWITSQTPIILAVEDTGIHKSGIKETKYRVTLLGCNDPCENNELCQEQTGSGIWSDYTTPFTIGEESCHLIEYYSVDNVNKTEIVKKQCVYVDNTPPEVNKEVGIPKVESIEMTEYKPQESYDVKDRAWFVNQSTLINLTCTDPLPHPVNKVEIYYKYYNDGILVQDWTLYTSPFTYGEDTYHELYYYCEDALGNKGPTHYQLDIVDTPPPVSQKTFDGLNIPCSQLACANETSCDNYITQDTKIELTCSDLDPHPVNDVKIYYRYFVDDVLHQDWTLYESSIQYDEDSKHTLEWYCMDALGNAEATHTQVERVDTEAPETIKTVGDPKWGENDYWITSQTPITLTTVDKEYPCASGHTTLYYEDWYDYNCDDIVDSLVNSGTVYTGQDCKLETTIYLNGECLHTLKWYAVDELGNTEEIHSQDHRVDDTPPHVLILKPVDGWYSEGEDIPIITIAEDLDGKRSPCGHDCNPLGKECAVGIDDGTQCSAYLLDILPEPRIFELQTEGTLLYNAEARECQGYATIPEESEIPDGVTILVVRTEDNLGNEAGSLAEILRAVFERCGCDVYDLCAPKCVDDVMQDIITIWNLPKIGIDNHAPEVTITTPLEGSLFGGEQVYFSANVTDSNDGDVTSTITSGTPCYITVGGVSLGIVPYNNVERKCIGTIMIPEDEDFPQGTQELKVEIADNAGNLGSDKINVIVDTVVPTLNILTPTNNQFVNGNVFVSFNVFDDTSYDPTKVELSLDNGQTWIPINENNPNYYQYYWDTTTVTDGMAYGIIARAKDSAGNMGYSQLVVVIVDNGSPEGVYIVNPVKNDIVEGTITLKALATDYVSGVESVKIYVESIGWNCDATLTDGTWQCAFDSTTLLDGNHQVYSIATDSLGLTTTSAHVPFIIDNNAPSAPVISVTDTDGDGYDTDGTVTWSWTSSTDEGSGIAYYEFMANDKPGDVITKLIGNFFTTSDLIDGTYVAKVRAVDKAGHTSDWSNEVTIKIDKIKPTNVEIWKDETKEDFYYDTNGHYHLYWNGGDDTNFYQYELFENDVSIYTGADKTIEFNDKEDGTYTYYIAALDDAGWLTLSNKIKVVVDKQNPDVQITGNIPGIGFFIATYSVSDPEPSSGIDRIVPVTDGYALCSGTFPTGFCTVFLGSNLDLTVYDKAGNEDTTSTTGTEKDITPPTIIYSSPSGVIDYNTITLEVKTDEPAVCHYGKDDDNETMTLMTSDDGKLIHTSDLETLLDGMHVYHVMCEDLAGNKLDSSKTIVFYIDTTGSYNLVIPDYGHYWSTGWNTFFLPKTILDNICGVNQSYPVESILSSLDGSNPSYDALWYFDDNQWLYYDPKHPELSTLTQFNDINSLPYYIKMNTEDRLEITQANCQTI